MIHRVAKKQRGFTLIESLVSIAIFVMIVGVVYETFFLIYRDSLLNWENTTVSSLASQYLENARNIPYAEIGTIEGNPNGKLPDIDNPITTTVGTNTYKAYFKVTYIDDPADGTILLGTDAVPTDYKQVKLFIKNTTTNKVTNFTTTIVPTGIENLVNGGALNLIVINGVGQGVPGATIHITNDALSPSIDLTRTSDANGRWIEFGLPNSTNSYHITATKSGYSQDQTYPTTALNPNPIKQDATIINGQITPIISFSIDKTSNLTLNTLDHTCSAISGIGIGIKGDKLIGTPSVLKYENSFVSSSSGQVILNNIEADNYTPALTPNSYMIYGSSPIGQINLLPDTTQIFGFILGPKTINSLLVIVKDASTGNAIEGANVELTNIGLSLDSNAITGGSLWSQQTWNGGSNQADWNDKTKYWQDDGGISTSDLPLALRLKNNGVNTLVTSGSLESSTFDTGSSGTAYTTLNWQPNSQDPAATIKFQIATNNTNAVGTTWDFLGPDGTNGTYYTTSGSTIGSNNNNKRYIRYKAYLSTTDTTKNPTLTSVNINYVSGCFTPGQVIFPGLVNAGNYQVSVSGSGYGSTVIPNLNISGYQTLEILLTPN